MNELPGTSAIFHGLHRSQESEDALKGSRTLSTVRYRTYSSLLSSPCQQEDNEYFLSTSLDIFSSHDQRSLLLCLSFLSKQHSANRFSRPKTAINPTRLFLSLEHTRESELKPGTEPLLKTSFRFILKHWLIAFVAQIDRDTDTDTTVSALVTYFIVVVVHRFRAS